MTTETVKSETGQTCPGETVESERGVLLALLVMVVLGVAGVYLISA